MEEMQSNWQPLIELLVAGDIAAWNNGRADVDKRSRTDAMRHNPPNLSGLCLKNHELSGVNFRNCNLSNAQFFECNLIEADLTVTNLAEASFDFSNLKSARLMGAHGFHTTFRHANLTGADFSNAQLSHPDFSSAVLLNANLGEAMLTGMILDNADVSGLELGSALHVRPISTKGTIGLPPRPFPPEWFKPGEEKSLDRLIGESKRLILLKNWKEAKQYIVECLGLLEAREDRRADYDALREYLTIAQRYTE